MLVLSKLFSVLAFTGGLVTIAHSSVVSHASLHSRSDHIVIWEENWTTWLKSQELSALMLITHLKQFYMEAMECEWQSDMIPVSCILIHIQLEL